MKRRSRWLMVLGLLLWVLCEGAFAANNAADLIKKGSDSSNKIYTVQVISVSEKSILELDHQAEQLYRHHRLICFIGKKGDRYTLSVGGFDTKDKAESLRDKLIKEGLINKDAFVRLRLPKEVPYLAISGDSTNEESNEQASKKKEEPKKTVEKKKEKTNVTSKTSSETTHKYSESKTVEAENKESALNSLLSVSIKDNKVILKGKSFWGKTHLSYLEDPPRYVLRLFNTENQSNVDTLYNPQREIEKLRITYNPHSKTTSVILNLKGEQECSIDKNGDKIELALKNSEVTTESGPRVVLGASSTNPFGEKRVFKGRRVSLKFKDADLWEVMQLMAEISKMNFVIDPNVSGKVTVQLKNVPWDQALDLILKMNGLGMIEENGIVRISTLDNIKSEMRAQEEAGKAIEKLEPLATEVIPLNYSEAKDVVNLIKPLLSDRGEVNVIERTNSLVVKDIRSRIDTVLDFIDQIDTPTPQVQIAAKIVDVSTDYAKELGIQWGFLWHQSKTEMNFPYSFGVGGAGVRSGDAVKQSTAKMGETAGWAPSFPGYVIDLPSATTIGSGGAIAASLLNKEQTFGIDMRLSALESNGLGKVISQPKVITLDNQEAKIEQGYEIPYKTVSESGTETDFEEATMSLTVTPHITSSGDIVMDVEITKDSPDFEQITPDGVPIKKRSVTTSVRMHNGDTLVIGGIYEELDANNKNGVPGLSRLPLLGWLFTHESQQIQKKELLIFITPTILPTPPKKPRRALGQL